MKQRRKQLRLSRRHLLRSASGATLALPLLDVMLPWRNALAADEMMNVTRYMVAFFHYGTVRDTLDPKGSSAADMLPGPYRPHLQAHANDILMIKNLVNHSAAFSEGAQGSGHARACGTYLTNTTIDGSYISKTRAVKSMDQHIADIVGNSSPRRHVHVTRYGGGGWEDKGLNEAYMRHISWQNSDAVDPAIYYDKLYQVLFGVYNTVYNENNPQKTIYENDKFLVDKVLEDAKRFEKQIGQHDKLKLDQYLTSVHETQKEIVNLLSLSSDKQCNFSVVKPSERLSFDKDIQIVFKLIKQAFTCDLTRVVVFNMASTGGIFPGQRVKHHTASHYNENAGKVFEGEESGVSETEYMRIMKEINSSYAKWFGDFLTDLKGTQDGDKNLLERSVISFGSGLRDSQNHLHDPLPILIAGHGNGLVKPGRVLDAKNKDLAALWLAWMQHAGVKMTEWGTGNAKSTSPLSLG